MKLHELELAREQQRLGDRHFYYEDNGNIVYYGRNDSDEYIDYNHAVLSYQQCQIIEESPDKSINDFVILVDPNNEGVYTLMNKQIELESFKSVSGMLSAIKKVSNFSTAYDIKIEYTPEEENNNLKISINGKLRDNVIKNMDVENFSFKGASFFNLYFTTPCDPHFMYDQIKVSLVDLFKNKDNYFSITKELSEHDVFTKKIFDKYEYKVKL